MKNTTSALCAFLLATSTLATTQTLAASYEKCYGIAIVDKGSKPSSQVNHDPCSVTEVPAGECEHVGYKDKNGNMHYGTLAPPTICKK